MFADPLVVQCLHRSHAISATTVSCIASCHSTSALYKGLAVAGTPIKHSVLCVYRAGLQPLETFLTKAIQLYEMIVVRHGLMLVGQSYGMKTAAYKVLAGALTGEPLLLLLGAQAVQQGL